ncbi:MAG: NmrA/HSCARG family protein [Flavisolibacter sp.]|nr:NmrA/HSCARG family protein [Flavisolibacter sp.]MBD0297162.1 NmrA/HSCARG family protein [Flavisolibacter sp.]MBD0352014.1 NmrA/HSCARG family protein [Flavisolibacter sp.]MBD0366356.1 NmrA/HSCARG family protein [Flavisolibacter sp.]MBD0375381.1 NmrA/HSCARG family protein [Flavisolibacter sp.]
MASKKTIVVFGATGAQGGGLARAILNDANSEFSVRAVTRDVNSEKAQELARQGAELIVADIDDPDSVQRALEGAYGAYFVTFYWAHFSPEKEKAEARTMAQAAKAAGLQHVIWSTLEDTREWVPLNDNRMPTLMGQYKVPHFDAKGESDKFFRELGVPTTFLRASFYWDNLIFFGSGPKRGADGKLAITFPLDDKKMAGIAAEDIGKCAYSIFKRGKELIGKTIGVAGDYNTGREIAEALSKALGQEVVYNNVSPDTFRSFGFPGAEDVGNMFQFYRDFEEELNKIRDVNFSRELNPELQSFEQWLEKNAQRIPLE